MDLLNNKYDEMLSDAIMIIEKRISNDKYNEILSNLHEDYDFLMKIPIEESMIKKYVDSVELLRASIRSFGKRYPETREILVKLLRSTDLLIERLPEINIIESK